ncbi:MAG TPA: hypothetical protein VNX86_02905 [Rhizomicrobium sp.]|jgi:hypothetical protein|nr:hypothetical protein [Rhizomicrobium sp.]
MREVTAANYLTTKAAALWQRILKVDHSYLFATASQDIRDRPHGFDRIPQPGFVGSQYRKGGMLLIGQNPGNDPIGKGASASDQLQYGLLIALRDAASSDAAVAAFSALIDALATSVMPNWAITKNVVQPLLSGLGGNLNHITYTNMVKFRTDDSAFAKTLYDESWKLTSEQIDLLAPNVIVALGVGTHEEFKKHYRGSARLYRITRTRGDTHLPPAGAADVKAIIAAEGSTIRLNPKDHTMKQSSLRPKPTDADVSEALNPKVTIEMLGKLQAHGFTNSHFSKLHHFARHSVGCHLAYCRKTTKFAANGTNPLVQLRLNFVLQQIEDGLPSEAGVRESDWQRLIENALERYPLV